MNYLKDKQYYVDRHDLHTIEECLDYYWTIKDGFARERNTHFAKYSQEKFEQEINKCLNLMLFDLKGERYRYKKETIQEWMDKDKQIQELYDNTPVPVNVKCKVCGSLATLTHKDLQDSYSSNAHMIFMFACDKCKKRQVLLTDGTEWKYEPPECPKCKNPLETDIKIKGEISTYTSFCPKCGYKDKNVHDHEEFRKEQEAKEKKDKELLEKYRDTFCLSEKDGVEYLETRQAMDYADKVREEEIRKVDNSYYPKALQIKKLGIVELEKLLSEKLDKEKYIKLSLDKPDIGQYVMVPFTVQDADSSRKGNDSAKQLEKLLKTTLEGSNWRLLSNSTMYHLGYVSGQLKGYESEEDILELAGKKKEAKPSKEDQEKETKYAGNNLVELAKLVGHMQGVEQIRKRRLEKEPEGFLLEGDEGIYNCRVCGESIHGFEAWWDLKGIKCLDCQRNLREGVIPSEFFESTDYGYDVIVKEWELKSYYGIHPATVKKLCRQGGLKGRELKRKDGTVYYTFFLVSENKEFFEKHPKINSLRVEYIETESSKS